MPRTLLHLLLAILGLVAPRRGLPPGLRTPGRVSGIWSLGRRIGGRLGRRERK